MADRTTPGENSSEQPPDIPRQGYGPHFEIDERGVITFAPPAAIDRKGNNVERLGKLQPTLRDLARELADALRRGNVPHSHLLARAENYQSLIDKPLDELDFALLYIAGVRLANAEKASSSDAELPKLEADVRETIDSLLQLHGVFVLSSMEGIEALAAEERYKRTPKEEGEFRAAALEFAESLQAHPEIVDAKVAGAIKDVAEDVGTGPNVERSGVVATGMMKNAAITFSIAAGIGAITAGAVATGSPFVTVIAGAAVLVAAEGLKKTKAFMALAARITDGINTASDGDLSEQFKLLGQLFKPQTKFFFAKENVLERIAGDRAEFSWLNKTFQWLRQVSEQAPKPTPALPDPEPVEPPSATPRTLGNIYLARVSRVEPALSAAFVDYGAERHGFLPFNRIHPDYFQIPAEDRLLLMDKMELEFSPVFRGMFLGGLSEFPIGKVVRARQNLLVQIAKEPVDNKGAVVTTLLSLDGPHMSLLPNGPGVYFEGVDGAVSEDHLEAWIPPLVPAGMGVLLRPSSSELTQAQFAKEIETLHRLWEAIRAFVLNSSAPALVWDANTATEETAAPADALWAGSLARK